MPVVNKPTRKVTVTTSEMRELIELLRSSSSTCQPTTLYSL